MDSPRLFTAETLFQLLAQFAQDERQAMSVMFYDPATDSEMAFDDAEPDSDRLVFYWFQG